MPFRKSFTKPDPDEIAFWMNFTIHCTVLIQSCKGIQHSTLVCQLSVPLHLCVYTFQMADVSSINKKGVVHAILLTFWYFKKWYFIKSLFIYIYRDENIPSVVLLCCSVPTKSRKAAINCQTGGGEVRPKLDRVPIWVVGRSDLG